MRIYRCAADVDEAVAAGVLLDDQTTREMRAYFEMFPPLPPAEPAVPGPADESGIPVSHIDMTGMTGVTEITIGESGDILSIVRDGKTVSPVSMPAASAGREN